MSQKSFFAAMLMAVGLGIMILSGTCTGLAFIAFLFGGPRDFLFGTILGLIFGGIPFGIGWVFTMIGKKLSEDKPIVVGPPPKEGTISLPRNDKQIRTPE